MYVIRATYGPGGLLYYAGPSDIEGASRYGVHRFSEDRRKATTFHRYFEAMRASWRAAPPRKHAGNMLTALKVDTC